MMKTTIRTIILSAAAIFAAMSCQKEESVPGTQDRVNAGETIQVNIDACLGDLVAADGTKATAESVVRLTWAGSETVQAYCGTEKISTGGLTVTPSANGLSAKLSGTIDNAPEANEIITFVYSSGCTVSDDGLTFDFSSQTETGGIPFVAYATLVYDGTATLTDKMVEFKFATSVMKIAATDLGGGKITEVAISGINTKVTLIPIATGESTKPTIAGGLDSHVMNITTENFSSSSDSTRAIVTVGLVPDNNATARKISFTKEGIDTKKEIAITSDTSDEIEESTAYYTPCAFEGANIESVIIGGRKWATWNLGATSVTEYGKLYSWGNLTGQSGDSFNPQFTNDVYKGTGGVATEGSKINNTDYIWTKTKHDAAYNELGGSWRMPNKDDFTALANACNDGGYTTSSITLDSSHKNIATAVGVTAKGIYFCNNYEDSDGIEGLLFHDGTNKLFFPAAGYSYSDSRSNGGVSGNYWSSTWSSSDCAYYLTFGSSNVFPQYNSYRYHGFSVRPVSD